MKYTEEYLLCCFSRFLVLLCPVLPPESTPCAAKIESNSEYFVVTTFFMKPHDHFSGAVTNSPTPFHTSTLIQAGQSTKIKSSPL